MLSVMKTPGPDGRVADFYKAFKREAAEAPCEVLNEAYNNSILPPSFLKSHTVIIPKSDDSAQRLSVSSVRLIFLTNVDYTLVIQVLTR